MLITVQQWCRVGLLLVGIPGLLASSACSGDAEEVEPNSSFLIELVFKNEPADNVRQAFISAKTRWEQLIVADVADVRGVPEDKCGAIEKDTVDDLIIIVELRTIDGPGGTLGQAGPTCVRPATSSNPSIPVTARMEFDADDLNTLAQSGLLNVTILHEMGHALGIGTLWESFGLLANPSCQRQNTICDTSGNIDTRYTGEEGVAAWRALGFNEPGVPVENRQGTGSSDGHWREHQPNLGPQNQLLDGPLALELMSPLLSSRNALSSITLRSLADLGYEVADQSTADPLFVDSGLSFSSPNTAPHVHMINDILDTPIYELYEDGAILLQR